MHPFLAPLGILALYAHSAAAFPNPQDVFAPPTCIDGTGQIDYTIESQTPTQGQRVTGDYTVPGGDTLSVSSTFSVGTTITVGGDLSIAKIVGLGLSASVSQTTTKSKTQGGSLNCPNGPWKCALVVYPQMLVVSGEQQEKEDGLPTCGKTLPAPYSVTFPVIGSTGDVESDLDVCACTNFAHWADPGAPSLTCDDCPL